MNKTFGRERRKWHRLPLAVPVFLRSIDGAGKESLEFATGLNVSAGGILVVSRRTLPMNCEALLEIPVAPFALPASTSSASRKLLARIVRVSHEEEFHLIGMRFLRPLLDAASPPKKKAVKRKRAPKLSARS